MHRDIHTCTKIYTQKHQHRHRHRRRHRHMQTHRRKRRHRCRGVYTYTRARALETACESTPRMHTQSETQTRAGTRETTSTSWNSCAKPALPAQKAGRCDTCPYFFFWAPQPNVRTSRVFRVFRMHLVFISLFHSLLYASAPQAIGLPLSKD